MYSVSVCSAIALCCGIISGLECKTECKTHLTSRLTEAFRKTVPGIQANCWIAAGSLFSLSYRQTQNRRPGYMAPTFPDMRDYTAVPPR